jgi:hypothetical protein
LYRLLALAGLQLGDLSVIGPVDLHAIIADHDLRVIRTSRGSIFYQGVCQQPERKGAAILSRGVVSWVDFPTLLLTFVDTKLLEL